MMSSPTANNTDNPANDETLCCNSPLPSRPCEIISEDESEREETMKSVETEKNEEQIVNSVPRNDIVEQVEEREHESQCIEDNRPNNGDSNNCAEESSSVFSEERQSENAPEASVGGGCGEGVDDTCPMSTIAHHDQTVESYTLEVPSLSTDSDLVHSSTVTHDSTESKNDFDHNRYPPFFATPPSPSGSYVKIESSTAASNKESTEMKTEAPIEAMNPPMPIEENIDDAGSDVDEKKMDSPDSPLIQSITNLTKIGEVLSSDDDDEKNDDVTSPLLSSIGALNKINDSIANETPPQREPIPIQPKIQQILPPPRTSFQESSSPSRVTYASPPGRRSIKLRLLEDVTGPQGNGTDLPFSKRLNISRRLRSLSLSTVMVPLDEKGSANGALPGDAMDSVVDRGTITVTWYEGTTSSEMQEHVWNCVLRKLNSSIQGGKRNASKIKLEDVRLLDENVTPHEEVVLCPFLPDGAQFLLRFRTLTEKVQPKVNPTRHEHLRPPYASRAPDSPSAEPVRFPPDYNIATMNLMNAQQLQMLNAAAALLQPNGIRPPPSPLDWNAAAAAASAAAPSQQNGTLPTGPHNSSTESPPTLPTELPGINPLHNESETPQGEQNKKVENKVASEKTTDQLIEQQLRQLHELFMSKRANESSSVGETSNNDLSEDDHVKAYAREEKKQVIFVIANYLVLFMSLIALSAEIQSRLPQWMTMVQENYDSVQNCATDRDALFECVSNGNFSGLVASFLLWATQSASAKRIFLFGFDSPKRLWTVVYEALVSAVCWGTSYIFIRRGLNPNTRQNFLQTYWKDAVYGSLAGFNAAFMKAVLKNLIPQDVALEALETRQLKIVNWLGALIANE